MRILVITNLYPPKFLGGYDLGCAQMVDCLRSRGHDVLVATSVSAGGGEDHVERVLELPPIYDRNRMDEISPEMQRRLQVTASAVNPRNTAALATIIDRFSPDVGYLWNLLGVGGLGILHLLRHQGIEWVWHIMDAIPLQITGFATSGTEVAQELDGVFPGRYVACSSHVLGEIRAGGVDIGDRVYRLPNWVAGKPPPPRERFYTGGRLRMLSSAGTLCEEKGTDIIIDAAARLRDEGYTNFVIDLYGRADGPQYRSMILERDVSNLVRLMGSRPQPEMLACYGEYDLFVFPTWEREPFAFAPLEAAASGCVPLFTSGCGNAEWMINGVDCLKASRDAEGFAIQIKRVLLGETSLEGVGRRAQTVVWRDFSLAQVADKVELLLSDAADERRPPRGATSEAYDFARFAEGVIQTLVAER